MKIFKIIGMSLGGLITVLLIAVLFVSNEFQYEKTISINQPNHGYGGGNGQRFYVRFV